MVWDLGLIWREDYISRAARAWLTCCEQSFPGLPEAGSEHGGNGTT
jgi:hypothetical protein